MKRHREHEESPTEEPPRKVTKIYENTVSIDELPVEILHIIFEFLVSPEEILNAGLVCQKFNQVSENNDLWKYLVIKTWSHVEKARMKDSIDWKAAFRKSHAGKTIPTTATMEKILNINYDGLTASGEESLLKQLKQISFDLKKAKNCENFYSCAKVAKLPQWLVEGTYFLPESTHTFACHDRVSERCIIYWTLVGLSGLPVSFTFEFYCHGYRDEAAPYANTKFNSIHEKKYLFLMKCEDWANVLPITDANASYQTLLEYLGCSETELPATTVFDYVTACSHYMKRTFNGRETEEYFFYEPSSTEFLMFWDKMFYKVKNKLA